MNRTRDDAYYDDDLDGFSDLDDLDDRAGVDDVEFEEYRPFRPEGSRIIRFSLVVLLILGLLAGGGVLWATRQIDPAGDPGRQVPLVVIPTGAGLDTVAATLEQKGVIANASLFGYWARWKGVSSWKAGRYVEFRENSSFADAVAVLDKGPLPPRTTALTIAPGLRLTDLLAKVTERYPAITSDQLNAVLGAGTLTSKYHATGTSWEGYLAPDTYQFGEHPTAEKILQTLVTQQDKILDDLGYKRAEALTGFSANDLVTIASLVEREAGAPPDEKGKIARVIFNRLQDGEILGIDAAIAYGLGKTGNLTKADLAVDTPYNNRKHRGLPPTAIAMPSKAALQAAIQAPEGPWIYYVLVSNDPPSHFFTASATEFQRAKEKAKSDGVF